MAYCKNRNKLFGPAFNSFAFSDELHFDGFCLKIKN